MYELTIVLITLFTQMFLVKVSNWLSTWKLSAVDRVIIDNNYRVKVYHFVRKPDARNET